MTAECTYLTEEDEMVKKLRSVHFKLDPDIFRDMKVEAAKNDITIANFLTQAIQNEINRRRSQ